MTKRGASKSLDKKLADAEKHLKSVEAENEAAMRRKKIRCEECKEATPLKDLTLIQTHWYQYSRDDWNTGETQYECIKCGHLNRDYKREKEFEEKGPYFGKHTDKHER